MLRARFAAGRTARRLAIDDFADDGDDRDRAAVRFGRVGGDPVFERDRIIFPRLAVVGGAADLGAAAVARPAAAEPVDQAGVERRFRQLIARRLHRARGVGDAGDRTSVVYGKSVSVRVYIRGRL